MVSIDEYLSRCPRCRFSRARIDGVWERGGLDAREAAVHFTDQLVGKTGSTCQGQT